MKPLFLRISSFCLAILLTTTLFGQGKQPTLTSFTNPLPNKIQKSYSTPLSPPSTTSNSKVGSTMPDGAFFLNLEKEKIHAGNISIKFNEWFGLSEHHTFQEKLSRTDNLGLSHSLYQHYYKGILVEGSDIMIHSRDDIIKSINGNLVKFDETEVDISIEPEIAKAIAKSYFKVKDLINDYPIEAVISKIPSESGAEIKLAYKIRIDSYTPFVMSNVYVDVNSGRIVNTTNLIAHADVSGTGQTLYSGNQPITCDSYLGNYRLRDGGRNIQTFNATNATNLTSNGFTGSTDFNNSSSTWSGVPALNMFTISTVAQSWWYAVFADETPDLYFKIKDGNGNTVFSSVYYNNTYPSVSWQNLGIMLTDPPYKVEVWDYDPVGNDDFGGSYSINTNTGTQSWSGNGNSGSYSITSPGSPAIDIHWGMEVSYDFYKNILNRDSYDGNGSVIKQYINPPTLQTQHGNSPNNASAYPAPYNLMQYGMGDGQSMYPVAGLDVEGHEYTHMIVANNGNGGLTYQGESGALNESFADIFGTCIEFYSGVNADWYIGEDVMVAQPYLRSMSNPKSAQQPDTYEGVNWVNPNILSSDNGGVHTNSGVQNHWFYLLSEGGSGTNDLNNSYTVTGIGIAKARDIAFRNLTTYLTSSATYMDAYYGSVQSAEDLFGNPSTEYTAVLQAWYAVGIGNDPNSHCSGITKLTSPTGSINDGSGSDDYNNNANCQWIIAPPGATKITLTFTAFDTEDDYDTVFVYDGPDDTYPIIATWWGNTLPPTLTTSAGVGAMCIKFTSDAYLTKTGWSANYSSTGITPSCDGGTVLASPSGMFTDGSGTSDYGNNQLCYWFIAPPCANSVKLSFSQFNTEKDYDGLVIYDDWDASNLLAVISGTSLPNSVTSTTGKMLVIFISDYSLTKPGFSASYTSTGSASCSGTTVLNTSDWGIISDGSGSSDYCNNLNCEWLIQPPQATSITLDFTSFDLEAASPDGQTVYDVVKVYDGTTTNAPLLGSFAGNNIPPSVTSSGGSMLIHFNSDLEVTKEGWAAVYSSTQNPFCNGNTILTAPNGTFSDGSNSNKYSNNSQCSWLIQPPDVINVTLNFTAFNTEPDYDGVIVYDGADNAAPILGQFSGSNIPKSVTSSGGNMYVEFLSDPAERADGWTANYTSTTCSTTTSQTSITVCDSYHWLGNTLTSSGTYTDTIPNALGCDSILTLNLNINVVDTSVTVNSTILIANATEASYQWIDCNNGNQPIPSQTNKSFTATENGMYAVIVTQNNCTDTSSCFKIMNVGIVENDWERTFLIYPNPTNGIFTVQSDFNEKMKLTITDVTGRQIFKTCIISKGENKVDATSLEKGFYLLRYEIDGVQKVQALILN